MVVTQADVVREVADGEAIRTALTHELYSLLDKADVPESLRTLITEALATPGKLLATPPGTRWTNCVLHCCVAAGGSLDTAIPAALAAELFALALDILDEIEDDDPSPLRERYELPLLLNGTTALLGLAQSAISRLTDHNVAEHRILACHRILGEMLTTAVGGQHMDLSAESSAPLSQSEILDIVARKSGSLVGGCCALGSTISGVDDATVALYRELGRYVGIAAQLDNDMHDLWEEVSASGNGGKSDLRRRKQTVPLAFLRDSVGRVADHNDATLATNLWDSGALPYAWAMVQVYREEAHSLLTQIDETAPWPGLPRALFTDLETFPLFVPDQSNQYQVHVVNS